MLSFKDLTEKKAKVKINPRLEDIKEGDKKKCSKCDGKGCEHCDDTGYHTESCGGSHGKKKKKAMSEAKKKDDTYLETDFKKRQANNEKARKDLMKGPKMKNPHFESKVYDPMDDPDFDHDEAEATRGQSGKNKSITIKKKTKKTTKEDVSYVSQEEVSEESDQSIGQKETSSLLTFEDFVSALNDINEGRAEDAKKSLDAVKKRQSVLDAHEKQTGKKLDITKTPEHKAHKNNFPGAKRQAKKVRGAKETPAEAHNRKVNTYMDRLKKHGKTTKQKRDDAAMAKHTSRFD